MNQVCVFFNKVLYFLTVYQESKSNPFSLSELQGLSMKILQLHLSVLLHHRGGHFSRAWRFLNREGGCGKDLLVTAHAHTRDQLISDSPDSPSASCVCTYVRVFLPPWEILQQRFSVGPHPLQMTTNSDHEGQQVLKISSKENA